jgi:hypothetical protein
MLSALALLALAGCAAGFVPTPAAHNHARSSFAAPRDARGRPLAVPTLQAFKLLPFEVRVPRALNPFDLTVDRPSKRPRIPGQDLYRQLGCAPDATYEEVSLPSVCLLSGGAEHQTCV